MKPDGSWQCSECRTSAAQRKRRSSRCVPCWNKYRKRLRTTKYFTTRDGRRRHTLYRYGITLSQEQKLHEHADGKCEICSRCDVELVVDHDHARRGVRGLICRRCNLMLGYASDDPEILQRGIDYLRYCEMFWENNHGARHALPVA